MNLIKELIEKYGGRYSEDNLTEVLSPIGKFTYQPKNGEFEINDTKFSININSVGGATPVAEPYRILLHLKKSSNIDLDIYPTNRFQKWTHLLRSTKKSKQIDNLNKEFIFKGDKNLIEKLKLDKIFYENNIGQKTYIRIDKRFPKNIMLTPEYGIENLNQIEKHINVLKRIEEKLKSNCT